MDEPSGRIGRLVDVDIETALRRPPGRVAVSVHALTDPEEAKGTDSWQKNTRQSTP
jgi:hypothetical protein